MLSIDFIYAHDPVKNRILVRVAKLTLIKGRTFRGVFPPTSSLWAYLPLELQDSNYCTPI